MIWRWLRCFHLLFVSSPHIIHIFSTASWWFPFGRPVSITNVIQSTENAWFISSNRFSHCLHHFLNQQHYILQLVKLNNGELSQNIDDFLPLISNYQYFPRAPCAEIQVSPCSPHHRLSQPLWLFPNWSCSPSRSSTHSGQTEDFRHVMPLHCLKPFIGCQCDPASSWIASKTFLSWSLLNEWILLATWPPWKDDIFVFL